MKSTTATLAAVVALAFIAAALIFGVAVTGSLDASTSPFITTVLGVIGPTILALVTLNRVESTRNTVESTNIALHNGLIPTKIQEAVDTGIIISADKQREATLRTRAGDPIARMNADPPVD